MPSASMAAFSCSRARAAMAPRAANRAINPARRSGRSPQSVFDRPELPLRFPSCCRRVDHLLALLPSRRDRRYPTLTIMGQAAPGSHPQGWNTSEVWAQRGSPRGRSSDNPLSPKFGEPRGAKFAETPLPRTPVNRGKKKGPGLLRSGPIAQRARTGLGQPPGCR
jgi:hypothetical protein